MAEFVMPALGADMEAGRLIAWMKKPGDRIERGEIIAEIDTDKGLIEVECFATGVVEKLLINPGDKVPVGTVLASHPRRRNGGARSRTPQEKPAAAPAEPIPAITTPVPDRASENFPRRQEDGRRIGNRPGDHYGHGAGRKDHARRRRTGRRRKDCRGAGRAAGSTAHSARGLGRSRRANAAGHRRGDGQIEA